MRIIAADRDGIRAASLGSKVVRTGDELNISDAMEEIEVCPTDVHIARANAVGACVHGQVWLVTEGRGEDVALRIQNSGGRPAHGCGRIQTSTVGEMSSIRTMRGIVQR